MEDERFILSKLSKKEKKIVVDELSKRVKDVVFMNAHIKSEEAFEKVKDYASSDDSIQINFTIEFLVNDIRQILGRGRRKEKR